MRLLADAFQWSDLPWKLVQTRNADLRFVDLQHSRSAGLKHQNQAAAANRPSRAVTKQFGFRHDEPAKLWIMDCSIRCKAMTPSAAATTLM